MGEKRGRRRWWWRWRDSPLRRRCDRTEAWAVLVTAVLLVLGGPAVGLTVHGAARAMLEEQREEVRGFRAVVLHDVPAHNWAAGGPGSDGTVTASVRWTDPAGTAHNGHTKVMPGRKAGDKVTVWTDRRGELLHRPPSAGDAAVGTVLLAVLAAGLWSAVVLSGLALFRARLERFRLRLWERAWLETEPRWREGRT